MVGLALVVTAGWIWRESQIQHAPLLPLTFAHADHDDVSCLDCHHNFVDDTGSGLCIDCHKQDAELGPLIEEQFHNLCRDCHVAKTLEGEDSGPVRQCKACHTPDTAP